MLETLDVEGALVTIDAMGCQKEIARKIRERGGDYVLTVKDNQQTLRADIQECLNKAFEAADPGLQEYRTENKGHGRIESRCYTVLPVPQEFRTGKAKADLHIAPGCYRVRSLHAGLASISEDGLKGGDWYRVVLWPAPPDAVRVIKQWAPATG